MILRRDSTFQDGHTTSHPVMCDLPFEVSLARDAIVSLILHCIVPDQEVFFKSLADENWILGVLVLLFILLGSLTVMKLGSCTLCWTAERTQLETGDVGLCHQKPDRTVE